MSDYYRQNRQIKTRFARSKWIAAKRELEWNLPLELYKDLTEMPCFYCKNMLGKPTETKCGLDRLDNDKGYIVGNVVSSCHPCNTIKSHILNPEETKAAVDAILELRNKNRK